jgi:hypothetical protein
LYPTNCNWSELLANPPAVYRGAPFWSWNNRLDPVQLKRQLHWLKEMGFGGAHIHVRTGMATAFMGPEFLKCVDSCVQESKRLEMLTWLYDEDRWPSGAAGGLVTKDLKYRAKYLLWTPRPYGAGADTRKFSFPIVGRQENGQLLARYSICLHPDGTLAHYRRLDENETEKKEETLWLAYIESDSSSEWYNNQGYVDTLNPKAIECFVQTVHEKYRHQLSNDFGKTIPAIFTDEPCFAFTRSLPHPFSHDDAVIAFTDDLPQTFKEEYKYDLLDRLPELFWELPQAAPNNLRWFFWNHIAERFSQAFAGTISRWCQKNDIRLTGHLMQESPLSSQTNAIGDAMRSLSYFQIPGIDILCDSHEYTTAKQSQSIAHQYGRECMMSELYGVTNWDFDFAGHLGQGNWQAALGVTLRVPHLTWVSMAGEAKRDYPASIGWQSPWFREYPVIEDHFARINVLMTRGLPDVRLAVIHPIESSWMLNGPASVTNPLSEQLNCEHRDLVSWLIGGQIDFDYISESLLPRIGSIPTEPYLTVGEMKYDAVLVPRMKTIRSTTLERLEAFRNSGGLVVFVDSPPLVVDARPSNRAVLLGERCVSVPMNKPAILNAVESVRQVRINLLDGTLCNSIIHQIRKDETFKNLFFCNIERNESRRVTIQIAGTWSVTRIDTHTGLQESIAVSSDGQWTKFNWLFPGYGSLLIRLTHDPISSSNVPICSEPKLEQESKLDGPVKYTLSEPNVLLLDQAQWRINEGPWSLREEILRLDKNVRDNLSLPHRNGGNCQPWADTADTPILAHVDLRYIIKSDIPMRDICLALELPEETQITWNGKPISITDIGWWVDESLRCIRLPDSDAGSHELIIHRPYTRKSGLEACYLLGSFGVTIAGNQAKLIALPETLELGDVTRQGLPFYSGNITYNFPLTCNEEEDLWLEAIHFGGSILKVMIDGKFMGHIYSDPYRLKIGSLPSGEHTLEIIVFGNRYNTFGQVHNTNKSAIQWFDSASWCTDGINWTYAYQLKPAGLLDSIMLLREER